MNLQEFKHCLEKFTPDDQKNLAEILSRYKNLQILGNGGSNAIASHMAEDYTKMLGKRAQSFSDAAMLTCYANDYGWPHAYRMYLEHFMLPDSLVILISSSGQSENILNAAEYASQHAQIITLSGFRSDNALKTRYSDRSLAHYYVASHDYGIVELMHNLILHSVISCG